MATTPTGSPGARRRGLAAPLALPAGFAALLAIGAIAAGSGGGVDGTWVLILAASVVLAGSALGEPAVAPLLGAIGWLTVVGFSRAPYAQLHPTGPVAARAAIVLGACMLAGAVAGAIVRRIAASFTLWIVDVPDERWPPDVQQDAADTGPEQPAAVPPPPPRAGLPRRWARGLTGLSSGIGRRRLLAGVILVAGLPLLTAALVAGQRHLSLADDLLIYLVAVVAVTVVGGFWPAVLAAVTSSLLLNWYFTKPLHTLTIADPQNLLALPVLGGADTPAAVLEHLTATRGGRAELLEQAGQRWVRVAVSGTAPPDAATIRVEARPGLELVISAQSRQVTARLLDGFAAQTAAALDRDRLRTQAAQAEALAEGNRMRTALLAAVSHDLRTPLASIKAS